ncbi:MAG TPA: ATPase domain-containing protein [Planctomycetaceae bacterium]|nr:ATPase domain-containing protein [Planctomycetaceae bacterium]
MTKRTPPQTPDPDHRPAAVPIRQLPTGVPGLDEILGGGLPEYSFNILAGAPGCGKTTLAHQIAFANATPEAPALYFTVLGEPAIKMLRYQQQFAFFDHALMDGAIKFVNLSQLVLEHDLGAVLDAIVKEVEAVNARIVVVDSFRTVVRKAQAAASEMELQGFVQRLALHLTSWQATTFLIGEYVEGELRDNPVFTVADGLLWLYQSVERNSIVRKLQVMKLRGQESVPGMHTFRITGSGLQTFPRTFGLSENTGHVKGRRRLSTGIARLDEMLGGGIPEGESVLLAGPSGSGKSTLGMQFIHEGLQQGEPGIVAIFEELPAEHVERAKMFGIDFEKPQKDGKLKLIYLRPLDLSVDETVHEIVRSVKEIGCKRLVIDSLVGFEMALAPGFREDFRESLYRMIAALTRLGVTIVSTVEIEEDFTSMGLSKFTVSFLSDDILRMRYVSINGQFRKMLMVVKMRRSAHSIDMHEYQITSRGLEIGEPMRGYRGLTTGIPQPWSSESGQNDPEPRHDHPADESSPPPKKPRQREKR